MHLHNFNFLLILSIRLFKFCLNFLGDLLSYLHYLHIVLIVVISITAFRLLCTPLFIRRLTYIRITNWTVDLIYQGRLFSFHCRCLEIYRLLLIFSATHFLLALFPLCPSILCPIQGLNSQNILTARMLLSDILRIRLSNHISVSSRLHLTCNEIYSIPYASKGYILSIQHSNVH